MPLNKKLEDRVQALSGEMLTFQSNAEHELIDHIHAARHEDIDLIIFNSVYGYQRLTV